jgi:hypothetical protein
MERLAQLRQWLAEVCPAGGDAQIAPASADASFRRYFRVTLAGATWIAMDAPPAQEDCRPFVDVAQRLRAAGLNVPEVVQADLARGFLLLTDLGHETYAARLAPETADDLYGGAIAALVRIQAHADPGDLPPYDAALLDREMALFRDWLLGRHLGLALTAAEEAALADTCTALRQAALEQPRTFVHRDYHSRNLMCATGAAGGGSQHGPGILDFQDAVHGPLTYDLVSLLRDCYVTWPAVRVEGWLADYRRQAAEAGLDTGDSASFRRWLDLMGVQRHLKASGIFARLWHRDGKPGYLADIPRTLRYIVSVGPAHPGSAWLAAFVAERVLPLVVERQAERSAEVPP